MAPKVAKMQAGQAAAEEPAAKKAKVDEPKAAEAKPAEVEKFQEPDAPKDNRPAVTQKIGFETADTTLNVVPTLGGKMLNCLSEGGMAYLLAGARANVAQKGGRYMFEAKVVQSMGGKNSMRIGFSTSSSGLIVGEDASSVYFDSEGFFIGAKSKSAVKNGRFGNNVVAVVLNLDPKSPNVNTLALYRDGAAVGEPMPLPEDLKGQALFPHIAYRSASVHVNFGPDALKQLPFKCRMLQSAAASDVTAAPSKQPKDGKYDVVMPVGFPDEGTFDWLDTFLQKNPQYVELSDRKIMQWATASGHRAQGGKAASNDKPQFNFGIRELDDMSVRKVINAVAPVMPRNYLIMEVKSNLVAAERQEVLKKFNYPCYKKTARVVMGAPNTAFKQLVQDKLLKEKQAKANNAFKAEKANKERKKLVAQRQKEADKRRKDADKARAVVKKKKEDDEKKAKGEAVEEEKEEPKEEEKEEPEAEKEDEESEPPVVELTDAEKKNYFLPKATPDLTPQVMSSSYGKFSTPDDAEGFDDIVYEWEKGEKATAYLKQWVLNKKLTTRVDDLRPGKDFKEKKEEFAKLTKEWKDKLAAWKAGGAKKPAKKADEEVDDVDIFSVADVNDIGKGLPLFHNFTFEDWELMNLRFQFCWLVLSFKVDVKDEDRSGIPSDHLNYYFGKYYGNPINTKKYGMSNIEEVLSLIKDTVTTKDGLVVSQLSDDLDSLEIFVKLTEEHRRERQRRIDAGDETARLKFMPPAEPKPVAKPVAKPAEVKAAAKPDAKPEAKKPETKPTVAGTPAPKAAVQKPAPTQKGWGKKGKW